MITNAQSITNRNLTRAMATNTVHTSNLNPSRAEYEKILRGARSQEGKILLYFQSHPLARLTAEEVNDMILPNSPVTSCRRALTNLMNRGFLEKSMVKKKPGSYGIDICTYTLTTHEFLQGKLF